MTRGLKIGISALAAAVVILLVVLAFVVGNSSKNNPAVIVPVTPAPTTPVPTPTTVPKVPYGSTVEVAPNQLVTAKNNGKDVLFENRSDVPFNIGVYGFGYVLADGTTGGALGTDHWGATLQPGEKFTSVLTTPSNAQLVMVVMNQGNEVEVARWTP